jgi:hypothetical protein
MNKQKLDTQSPFTLADAALSAEQFIQAKGWKVEHFSGVAERFQGSASFRGVLICKGAGYSKLYSVHRFNASQEGFHLWAGSYDLTLDRAKDLMRTKQES